MFQAAQSIQDKSEQISSPPLTTDYSVPFDQTGTSRGGRQQARE